MLGRRDPQSSIFDGDQRYLGHVGEKTFYAYLAQHRHELFRDDDYADLYRLDWGPLRVNLERDTCRVEIDESGGR